MNCYTRATICRHPAQMPELSCSVFFWWQLTRTLRRRSAGRQESGAFLLGKKDTNRHRITKAIFYDDLDPQVFASGIVHFDGRYFARLWDICQQECLLVIADVHTHPGTSGQSQSDREHPMIAQPGHVALILPRYARDPWNLQRVGVYRYRGARQWETLSPPRIHSFFTICI